MIPVGDGIAIVVIGRNEGERLERCLASLPRDAAIVYVDSGSTDGSVAAARRLDVTVVELDPALPFTAARARNAGLAAHVARGEPEFVQMIDGDCVLDPGWLPHAVAALRAEAELAVVFGRRRERYPERSIFNKLCDDEWNVPVGEARSCGGDALFRAAPLIAAGGYEPTLIAGEEPDLCLRLRARGWRVRRIEAEMTVHDAAMTRFGQWWRRARRAGHAYLEHVVRHGARADPDWRRQVASIVLWGMALPVAILIGTAGLIAGRPIALTLPAAVLAIYAAQWWRIASAKRRAGADRHFADRYGTLMLVGKFAGLDGMIGYLGKRVSGSAPKLIEYKAAA